MSLNSSTKSIIGARIVANHSPKHLCNAIFLKKRQKSVELVISTIAYYQTKPKKGFPMPFLITINEISSDPK